MRVKGERHRRRKRVRGERKRGGQDDVRDRSREKKVYCSQNCLYFIFIFIAADTNTNTNSNTNTNTNTDIDTNTTVSLFSVMSLASHFPRLHLNFPSYQLFLTSEF